MRKSGRCLEILVPELSACINEVNDKGWDDALGFLQVLSRADHVGSYGVDFTEYLLRTCGINGQSDGCVSQAAVLAYADSVQPTQSLYCVVILFS
jgi:hypothetical protein